jgi:hypothetical protein
MSDNIKPWGCFQRSSNRKFAQNKEGKPVVRITTEMECRYDTIVNEEESNPDEEELGLLLGDEEADGELEEDSEDNNERPQDLKEPVLNEARASKASRTEANQQKRADKEMEKIRNDFRRFL